MKFAEHLTAHITPEWRKQYINYEEMKSMLYNAIEEAPSPESTDPNSVARYFTSFDEQFFSFCDRELKKINTFYSGEFFFNIYIFMVVLTGFFFSGRVSYRFFFCFK